jgi:multiple sugar transport system ATP-binding protein
MADVVLSHVSKRFGDVSVIEDLNLEVIDQEFMVLVGPSGCGKSTALRMIAGLEEITAGEIHVGGRKVNDLAPKDRDIAMVFQSYALYPHMSVRQNLEFGLKMRKVPKAERDRLVAEAADVLDIDMLLDRKPKQLSGGQRQRVAVGRAIVRKPAVFLFDEPLSNLDAKLRIQMRAEISKLQHRLKTTTIYVTHDQVEAMTMGHRIAVLKDGKLQQVGTPLEVYERPANLFVANFIGTPPMNFFTAEVADGGARLVAGSFSLALAGRPRELATARAGRQVVVGVRPENLVEVGKPTRGPVARLPLEVEIVEPLGHEVILYGSAGEDHFTAKLDPSRMPRPGETVEIAVEVDALHLFDPESEQRLS